MVLLTTTPCILEAIAALSPTDLQQASVTADQLPTSAGMPISHTTLVTIHRLLVKVKTPSRQNVYSLNTLLRGAYPYIAPPKPPAAKSAAYLALMARLRAEQEQREYYAMIAAAAAARRQRGVIGDYEKDEAKEKDDIYPSLVFNILLSVVMCSIAVFVVTRYWPDAGLRVLVSLGAGLVVGMAEVGVYAIYLRNVRVAREKEQRKKERKVVIVEQQPPPSPQQQQNAEGNFKGKFETETETETEEIWGRGKHGGMRLRVREKWRKDSQVESEQQTT